MASRTVHEREIFGLLTESVTVHTRSLAAKGATCSTSSPLAAAAISRRSLVRRSTSAIRSSNCCAKRSAEAGRTLQRSSTSPVPPRMRSNCATISPIRVEIRIPRLSWPSAKKLWRCAVPTLAYHSATVSSSVSAISATSVRSSHSAPSCVVACSAKPRAKRANSRSRSGGVAARLNSSSQWLAARAVAAGIAEEIIGR